MEESTVCAKMHAYVRKVNQVSLNISEIRKAVNFAATLSLVSRFPIQHILHRSLVCFFETPQLAQHVLQSKQSC